MFKCDYLDIFHCIHNIEIRNEELQLIDPDIFVFKLIQLMHLQANTNQLC